MVSIMSLWAPIVVSAVLVFVVSSIVHMVLTYHKSDYRQLPREAETLDTLRRAGLTPGVYHFPYAGSPKAMGSPEMIAKYNQGPVGLLTVMPGGPPAMPKYLAFWFAYSLLVGVFVACLTGWSHAAGTEFRLVFCFASTAAFLAYGIPNIVDSIWKGQTWGSTLKHIFDGLLYALVTAAAFGWLWPH